MSWLLAIYLILSILLVSQITSANIHRKERIKSFLGRENSLDKTSHDWNNLFDNSYNNQLFYQRTLRSIDHQALDISDTPSQAPTMSPTSTQSKDDKISPEIFAVAFGILAIIFLASVLSFFLCGRYFYHRCRETGNSQSAKVFPTFSMGGTELSMIAGPISPRLDYSEYLRQQMAVKSNLISTEDYQSQKKEKEKIDKEMQEQKRKQIENIINVKLNESQSQRSSISTHGNTVASKYRISDAELLDIENSPHSS